MGPDAEAEELPGLFGERERLSMADSTPWRAVSGWIGVQGRRLYAHLLGGGVRRGS